MVIEYDVGTIELYDLAGALENAINTLKAYLAKAKETLPNGITEKYYPKIVINREYDEYDPGRLVIKSFRKETSKEKEKRIQQLKKEQESTRKFQEEIDKKDRKEYERLKKKFEKNELF